MSARRFIGQSAASAAIRAGGTVLSLVLGIVMARLLSPAGYGVYAYVMSMVALLTVPAKFGLPLLVARETARAVASGETAMVWALWLWAHRLVFVTGAAVLAGLALWLTLVPGDRDQGAIWIWAGALVPILALSHLRSAALRGLGHPLLSQMPEMILRPGMILGLAVLAWAWAADRMTAEVAVMLNTIGSAIVLVSGMVFVVRRAPPRPPRGEWPRDRAMTRAWLVSSFTMGLTMGIQVVGGNMDVLMLGHFVSDSDVGLYKVALNGGSLVSFGLQSINMVLLPRVAGLYRKGELTEVQRLVTLSARLALLVTVATCAVLVVGGRELIALLFGSDYADAYRTLVIIGAGQLVSTLFGPVMLVVLMSGHERPALYGTIGFTLSNLVLNLGLIPLAGKEGAATATAVSLGALNLYLWIVARRQVGVDTSVLARSTGGKGDTET